MTLDRTNTPAEISRATDRATCAATISAGIPTRRLRDAVSGVDSFNVVDRSGRDSVHAGPKANITVLMIDESATMASTRLSGDTSMTIGLAVMELSDESTWLVAHHTVRSAVAPPSSESSKPSMNN